MNELHSLVFAPEYLGCDGQTTTDASGRKCLVGDLIHQRQPGRHVVDQRQFAHDIGHGTARQSVQRVFMIIVMNPSVMLLIPESDNANFTAVGHVVLDPAARRIDELAHPVLINFIFH